MRIDMEIHKRGFLYANSTWSILNRLMAITQILKMKERNFL